MAMQQAIGDSMETNLETISALADAREDENCRFRTFLKGYAGDIDTRVHHYYHEVSSQIDCTSCANCCTQLYPLLNQDDIQRLAQHLKISSEQVIHEYLTEDRHEGQEGWTFRELPCPFLQDYHCTQYACRPQDCRSYPHLQKSAVVSRLWGILDNYAICPIVFNVVELLKAEVWFRTQSPSLPSTAGHSGIRVSISAIVNGMDEQTDEIHAYLNHVSGQVVTVSDEELEAAEIDAALDEFPAWQHHALLTARDIVSTDRYLPLPSKYELHEYAIVEQFCLSLPHETQREALRQAIRGRGAFRRFREAIAQYQLRERWETYRENTLRDMAIIWCTEHGIGFCADEATGSPKGNDG